MDKTLFSRFPAEGLIKSADRPNRDVESDRKVKLNRKGNELFNGGDVETARRIFQTTGYSDGLIRVGDHYRAANKPVEALKMYWLARDERKIEELVGTMAAVIQKLLHEEEEQNE
ncbi:MAG TPA: hypothetical protein VMC79_13590 [Rectinemataceae bacterium]|nr:hypothetical protein [Rectinemataceae bacterium]